MTVVASKFERSPNDLYQTAAWATRALLGFFPVSRGETVWEPCAGNHHIVDVIREAGASTYASDIATYDRPQDAIFDFLDVKAPLPIGHHAAIITNPPYGKGNHLAAKFARLALARCAGMVCLLLPVKYDCRKTAADLFRDNPRFCAKIVLLDRIQWFPPGEGTEDHAWFVWMPTAFATHTPARLLYAVRAGNEVAL